MENNFPKIETYVQKLRDMLWFDPFLADRAVTEAHEKLYAVAQKAIAEGKTVEEAQDMAIEQFGKSKSLATKHTKYELMSRFFLNLGATFSILIALFLVFVLLFVLPKQQPEEVPFWGAVTVFFMLYGVLTFSYLRDRLVKWLRTILWIMSLLALAGGVYGFVKQVIAMVNFKDFEGYIIVMAILLIGHAKVLLFDLWGSHKKG